MTTKLEELKADAVAATKVAYDAADAAHEALCDDAVELSLAASVKAKAAWEVYFTLLALKKQEENSDD